MAIDLQVAYPQSNIPLTSIQYLTGYSPASILLHSHDFRSADEVQINGEPSPLWTVLNVNTMVVKIPTLQVGRPLDDVLVLSNRLTFGPESLLRFKVGRGGRVSGITRLVQLYVKVLLTTPGTDIYSPTTGGGLLTKIGSKGGLSNGVKELIGEVVLCCNNTTKQIITTQSLNPSMPPVERLLTATVEKATFDRNTLSLQADIAVMSHSGVRGWANMLL